jgi:hypothetical protein
MAKGEWGFVTKLIDAALEILSEESPMTIRQLFYRMVSRELLVNSKLDYQRLSRFMTKAREDGRCDYDLIVDRSRPVYEKSVWKDPSGYARTVKHAYHKDYWAMQPRYCEIWAEKDAIVGSIEDLTRDLGVTLRVGRGFLSATRVNDIATHFANIEKPKTVFYLGDQDPSGQEIEATAFEKVWRRFQQLMPWPEGTKEFDDSYDLSIERLAIHKSDIEIFDLPPLKIKDSDSRAAKFRKVHGKHCVELDALPPTELRRRIREAVEGQLDRQLWDRAIEIEEVELRSVTEFAEKWGAGA